MSVTGIVLTILVDKVEIYVLFFIFGGITFLNALFAYFFTKDISGLTDKEKKSLYAVKKSKPVEDLSSDPRF